MAVPGLSNTNSYQTNQQGMRNMSPNQGGIGSFLLGTNAFREQFPTITPEQSQILQQLLGGGNIENNIISQNPLYQSGSNFLQSLLSGNNEDFAKPYQQSYQQDIQKLANQFSGAGLLSGSSFQNAASGRAAQLQNELANLNTNAKLQGLGPALNYAQSPTNAGLQGLGVKSFGTELIGRQSGLLENLLLALAQGATGGIGKGIGSLFANYGQNSGSFGKPSSAV